MIRERWPNVDILLRGDSGFARENLMRWCEGNAVDYVFGLARNDVLLKKAQRVRGKAAMAMNRPAGPRLRRFPPHHQIQNLGPTTARHRQGRIQAWTPTALPIPRVAIKSRPGNSTKTPIAHAATWKTA